jgi:hypothetical protein
MIETCLASLVLSRRLASLADALDLSIKRDVVQMAFYAARISLGCRLMLP